MHESDEVVLAKLALNLAGADVTARIIIVKVVRLSRRRREEEGVRH